MSVEPAYSENSTASLNEDTMTTPASALCAPELSHPLKFTSKEMFRYDCGRPSVIAVYTPPLSPPAVRRAMRSPAAGYRTWSPASVDEPTTDTRPDGVPTNGPSEPSSKPLSSAKHRNGDCVPVALGLPVPVALLLGEPV